MSEAAVRGFLGMKKRHRSNVTEISIGDLVQGDRWRAVSQSTFPVLVEGCPSLSYRKESRSRYWTIFLDDTTRTILRSILRQHIDSFDHFVDVEMKEIVSSPSACEIRSDHDPKFYLRYEACWIGEPSIEEESYSMLRATPFQCRLRDCTYSTPIYVSVRCIRGNQIVAERNVIVGRMPIMLRSRNCVLRDKTEDEQNVAEGMLLWSRRLLYY